jgi:outer membrane scaffolding protein for murein synthesis (MipA/OmpV family)
MMKRTKASFVNSLSWRLLLLAAVLVGMPTSGFADDMAEDGDERNWELMIGAGGMLSPLYPGSDEMELTPFPAIIASYDSPLFRLFIEFNELGVETTFGSFLQVSLSAGAGLGDFERDNDDDMLEGSPSIENRVRFFGQLSLTIPESVGIGARASYFPLSSSYDEADRKDKDYSGMTFEVFVEREWMLFPFIASVGGGCTWMNSDYAEAVYGVNYATSDLPAYHADLGLHDLYFTTNLMFFFTEHIGIGTTIDCEYLLGDAGGSPFTERAFQPTIGAYALYRF